MTTDATGEQLTLAGLPAPRRRRRASPVPLAERAPVARVLVDRPQPHLDRAFEYAVPAALDDVAVPGVRVKVRFGGQDVDGFLAERLEDAEHDGELAPLRRVVSPEPVLSARLLALVTAVARRYAGTTSDVLRLAVPPRHARTEAEEHAVGPDGTVGSDGDGAVVPAEPGPAASAWRDHAGGPAFLRRVAAGEGPRAVWGAAPGGPGDGWAEAVAEVVVAARAGRRGALVVVPTATEVAAVTAALDAAGVAAWTPERPGGWVRLQADDGPSARYRSWLAVLRGSADVAVGTRAAAFAPVRDLGVAVCWDDGHGLHREPRSPYPHVREVLRARAELEGCALLVGGYSRSTATARWLHEGFARPLVVPRAALRERTPRVSALTSAELAAEGAAAAARLPSRAWRAIRAELDRGPVLVQVPRAGYLPAVACATCRAPARCTACAGPLGLAVAGAPPSCRWCGRLATRWRCPHCRGERLRSIAVGSDRTAEELGRAFPGVAVRVSASSAIDGVLAVVPDRPALVVATPGAEPRAAGGYGLAVLLDAAVTTSRPGLDAGEAALRTWLGAAALVRPGGDVLLVGDAAPAPTQALVRWDPAGLADRDLAERAELRLPPAVVMAALEGSRGAVARLLVAADLPTGADVLGPLPVAAADGARPSRAPQTLVVPAEEEPVRALVRAPWSEAGALTRALTAAQAVRSARRDAPVRVQVDPEEVL